MLPRVVWKPTCQKLRQVTYGSSAAVRAPRLRLLGARQRFSGQYRAHLYRPGYLVRGCSRGTRWSAWGGSGPTIRVRWFCGSGASWTSFAGSSKIRFLDWVQGLLKLARVLHTFVKKIAKSLSQACGWVAVKCPKHAFPGLQTQSSNFCPEVLSQPNLPFSAGLPGSRKQPSGGGGDPLTSMLYPSILTSDGVRLFCEALLLAPPRLNSAR
jgi:hypothetical protein